MSDLRLQIYFQIRESEHNPQLNLKSAFLHQKSISLVYFTTNERPSVSKAVELKRSRRSLKTTNKPVPLRFSHAKRTFDENWPVWPLYCNNADTLVNVVNE